MDTKLNYITEMMLNAYATNIASQDWLQTKKKKLEKFAVEVKTKTIEPVE